MKEKYYIEADGTLYIVQGDCIKCLKCPAPCSASDKWLNIYTKTATGCYDGALITGGQLEELTEEQFFINAL